MLKITTVPDLLMLVQATQGQALPVCHLRSINPHVATTLESQGLASVQIPRREEPFVCHALEVLQFINGGASHHKLPPCAEQKPLMPHALAAGGQVAASKEGLALGTSAFAFQGTNAHAIIACLPPAAPELTSYMTKEKLSDS
eukprot:scaffold177930_cov18-Tisochrysis_lutea.AAC.1